MRAKAGPARGHWQACTFTPAASEQTVTTPWRPRRPIGLLEPARGQVRACEVVHPIIDRHCPSIGAGCGSLATRLDAWMMCRILCRAQCRTLCSTLSPRLSSTGPDLPVLTSSPACRPPWRFVRLHQPVGQVYLRTQAPAGPSDGDLNTAAQPLCKRPPGVLANLTDGDALWSD